MMLRQNKLACLSLLSSLCSGRFVEHFRGVYTMAKIAQSYGSYKYKKIMFYKKRLVSRINPSLSICTTHENCN